MATIARFIGVDRHADAAIRELTGARRDATALWALFTDSLPDIDSALITDQQATMAAVSDALDEGLGRAGPDDTVIFAFSGHGTHDHALVTYDSSVSQLPATTISMSRLATSFKKTRAKRVLIILDCCFSGGAPARVLEDSPIVRDLTDPYNELAGQGRMLLAASNFDEPAYELPGTGHGLLTHALLETLQAEDGPFNLDAAVSKVMDRVRAEAARIGVIQTPVSLGHVTGGLRIPALRRGKRYAEAFPESKGVQVSSKISELAAFGIPETVLDAWQDWFPDGLNGLQLAAVNDKRILDGSSLFTVAPTSAGKTFIGELASVRAILEGRKAVFLLPYKALTNEKYEQFSALYGDRLGFRVVRCTGDYLDQTDAFIRGRFDLALLTYEMFLSLAVANDVLLTQIGLVVLDEGQFITDPNRGITVELIFTYLIAARERGVNPQLIALSAVVGDLNDFDRWLGTEKLITISRPVPLLEGVLDRNGTFQLADADGQERVDALLQPGNVRQRKDKPSAQDVVVPLVRQLVAAGEKVIVFRNQRGPAAGCATYLAAELGLPPAEDALAELPTSDLSSTSTQLRRCLSGGTAFHSTNLTREEREVVERAFRDPDGPVRVLAATTTVAAGINTPASTVIIAEQEFLGEDGRPFTVAEYKNMAGRAGRLGFNEEGKAIILAETSSQREHLFHHYVRGSLEPIRSSFDASDLNTWVVRLLAQIRSPLPRAEVIRLLANTYGGFVAARDNPNWRTGVESRIEALLDRMSSLELVHEARGEIELTLLGRACGNSSLSFESALRLVESLRTTAAHDLTPERLMALVQVLPEGDATYTPVLKRGQRESIRARQAAERFGSALVQLLQRHAADMPAYLARCKRVAILWDWIHGAPIDELERTYSTTPFQGSISHGDVRRIADSTRFHLRSAYQIAAIMYPGEGPPEDRMEALLRQLEVGIPADALPLLELPVALTRGEYLSFYQGGIRTPDDLWQRSEPELAAVVGERRAHELESLRPLDKAAA
ncbi:MAG: DEAD/DEAH box helicase [Gammaproteobacteria bacterium]